MAAVMPLKIHTLAATPTEPDPAATNGESLHLLDSPLGIWLANKLYETAVFTNRYLDLETAVSYIMGEQPSRRTHIVDLAKGREERPQCLLGNQW